MAALLAALGLAAAPPAALAASGAWQAIGPSGGTVIGLTIDPAAPGTVYASAGGGGLFKTLDGGRHWARSDAGLLPNYFLQVAVDPEVSTTVISATGRGIWKSSDGGTTWAGPASGLGTAFVSSVVVDPRRPSTLYAASGQRVWKSVDGGTSWIDSGAGLSLQALVITLAIDPRRPATLYAGTTLGVFQSLDHGAHWRPARKGMGTPDVLALTVDPLAEGTVYAGVQQNFTSTTEGLFVSTNGGMSWAARRLSTTPPNGGVSCLAVSPAAPRTVYACSAGIGLFKSIDGGRRWGAINSGLGSLGLGSLAIDPSLPDRVYAGANEFPNAGPAVYKTSSGGAAWAGASDGIDALDIPALVVDPAHAGTLYAGTPGAGIYASTDDGGHWAPANAGLRGATVLALAADPLLPETLYVETERGFFASAGAAAHWSRPGARFNGAPPMIVDPQAAATLFSSFTAGGGLFRTVDGGATWSPVGGGVTPSSMAIAPSDPATVYLAEHFFIEDHEITRLFVSHDGGATFQVLPPIFRRVMALTADPASPGTLYLAANDDTGGGLWKSTDGGQTVTRLPGIELVAALLIDPADSSVIYAGTSSDVLVSADGGATWSELAPGLPGSPIVQLAFGASAALYVATEEASVWRLASTR